MEMISHRFNLQLKKLFLVFIALILLNNFLSYKSPVPVTHKTQRNYYANQTWPTNLHNLDPNTTNCATKIAPKSYFNLIPLLSLPGSGNTWTRFLIERATGFATGSCFHEVTMVEGGLIGELQDPMDNETIVVKFHSLGKKEKVDRTAGPITACVYLLRNPRYSILSDFTRRCNNNKFRTQYHLGPRNRTAESDSTNAHTSKLDPTLFNSPIWTDTKANLTSKLNIYINTFEVCNKKIHILPYEKLSESPEKLVEEISKLIHFISKNNKNNPIIRKDELMVRLKCLMEDSNGSFQRVKSKKPDMNLWFDLSEKKNVNDRLNEMQKFFRENNIDFQIPAEYYFSVSD